MELIIYSTYVREYNDGQTQLGITAINKHRVLLCELSTDISLITLASKPSMNLNVIISRIEAEDTFFFIPIENRKTLKDIRFPAKDFHGQITI